MAQQVKDLSLPTDVFTRKDVPPGARNVKETLNTFEWMNPDGSHGTLYKNPSAHVPDDDADLAIEQTATPKVSLKALDESPTVSLKALDEPAEDVKAPAPTPEEPKTWSSVLTAPGIWTAAKTAALDLVSPLSAFRNAKSFSPGLELLRAGKTMLDDMTDAQKRTRADADQAIGKAEHEGGLHNWSMAGLKTLLSTMGPVGSMVNEGVVNEPDPAKIVGHVAAAVLGKKVYETAWSPLKTTRGAYRGIKNAAIDVANSKFEPHIGLMKALRPKNTNLSFSDTAEKAMQAINDTGAKPRDIHELDAAAETAIHDLVQRAKTTTKNRPTLIDGAPIARAIKAAVPKLFRHENPDIAADIDAWADARYDHKFTVEQLDEFRKDANAKTSGYYNTKMPNQQMALDRTLDSNIATKKANAIRQTLYDGLDAAQGTGTALREINQRIRSLLTIKDALDRRWNVELRQAAQNLPQQVSKLMAFGRFAKAAKMMVAHNPVGAAGEALTGLGEVGLADFMKELNSTNGQVASAFRRYRTRSGPLTMNPVPRAAKNRALASGSTAANPKTTVQPSTLTGSATPGQPLNSQGWNRPTAIPLAAHAPLRDRLGRFTSAEYYTGELPPSIRPVGRGASGQFEQVWQTALKQHTKTMKDVLHTGEEPPKRDPKTGRFLPREKK